MEKFTSNNFAFSDDVSLRSITISDLTRSIKFGLKVKDEDILNYACLASHVYGDKKDSLLQNGWHKSNEPEYKSNDISYSQFLVTEKSYGEVHKQQFCFL